MFEKALTENREAIYAILSSSPTGPNAITPSLGSAFMVAPGLLVTSARCLRDESRPGAPPHEGLRVIRALDIGKEPEPVTVLAANARKDLALLRIAAPRSTACLRLLDAPVPVGTHCGTAGFPRITVDQLPSSAGLAHRVVPGGGYLLLRERDRHGRARRHPVRDGFPLVRRPLRQPGFPSFRRGVRHVPPARRPPSGRRDVLGPVDDDPGVSEGERHHPLILQHCYGF